MLEILSLGVCLACISCMCCLCTATLVAVPGLVDLSTGLLLGERRKCDDSPPRKCEENVFPDGRKTSSNRWENSSPSCNSQTCPCVVTYVLDPISLSQNTKEALGDLTRRKRSCRCPSFRDLVGDSSTTFGKVLPRS